MLVLTVLSLNIFGEGVRDALDPRAKVRIDALMLRFIIRRADRDDRWSCSRSR